MASILAIRTVRPATMRRLLATSVRLARKLVPHATPLPPTVLAVKMSQALSITTIQIMSATKLALMEHLEIPATTNVLLAITPVPNVSEPVLHCALNAKLTPALTTSYSMAAPVAFPLVLMATIK